MSLWDMVNGKGEKGKIGEVFYMIRCRCHLKCHPIETAACLCFAALRLFPSVHISDLDPSRARSLSEQSNHDQISVCFSVAYVI